MCCPRRSSTRQLSQRRERKSSSRTKRSCRATRWGRGGADWVVRQELLGVERDQDRRTRHRFQDSNGQRWPDRHSGPVSGNGCELRVTSSRARLDDHQTWDMLQENEPTDAFLRKLKKFQVDKRPSSKVPLWQLQEGRHGATGQGSKDSGKDRGGWDSNTSTIYRSVAVKNLHKLLSDTQHPLNHVLSSQVYRRASSQRLRWQDQDLQI